MAVRNPPKRVAANRALNSREVKAGRLELHSAPQQVNIELTGICNVRPPCVFCSGKNFGHEYPHLSKDHLKRYANFLDRCTTVTDDSFGEPLTHPEIAKIASEIISRGQCFNLATNGLLLRGEVASHLADCGPGLGMHVSFNAATPETYFKLTGRDFSTLVENIRCYVRLYRKRNENSPPNVTLTFIVMRLNLGEVQDFLAIAQGLGLNALLAPLHDRPSTPLGHYGYAFDYVEEMVPFSELKDIGEAAQTFAAENGIKVLLQWDSSADSALRGFAESGVDIPCLIPWRFLFIQEHSQKIVICPYHRHPIGHLDRQSVEEVWNGKAVKALRRSLVAGEIPDFCWNNSESCPLIFSERDRGISKEIDGYIEMGVNDYWHLDDGWYPLEYLGELVRWTSERATFSIQSEGAHSLFLQVMTWKPDVKNDPTLVRVSVEGRDKYFRLDEIGRWYTCGLRLRGFFPAWLRSGKRVLEGLIRVDNPWMPSETLNDSLDSRSLGVMVRRIWME